MKTDVTIKDSCKESPVVTDLSSSPRSAEVSLIKQKGDNVDEPVDMGPDFSQEGSSMKTDATIKDSCKDSPVMNDLSSYQGTAEVSLTKRKGDSVVELINIGPDFSLEHSSVETDATIKDSCKDSPTMTDLSSSQRSVEVSSTMNKRRKSWSMGHNATVSNVNGIVIPKDTFSTETSVPTLQIIPLHPVQCLSMNPVTRNSCAGSNFCPEENEGKDQTMLERAAETSNAERDLQEVRSKPNSVVANVDHFVKESMSEVASLNTVQGTIDNSSNPEDNSGYVKNESPVKKLDDYGINSEYSSSVDYDKEPNVEVDNKDDSNKITDEPLKVGLVEKETKVLRGQVTSNGGGALEEMMLMTKNTYEQRVTDVSVTSINEMQLEEDNGAKLDGNQITGHDMSSAGEIADLSLISKKEDHSRISDFWLDRTFTSHSKKLLVLDVNGILADFVDHVPRGYHPDTWISRKSGQISCFLVSFDFMSI